MRKQFILLTLFVLLTGHVSAQAQLPKASDYFPLEVGNVWQYDNTNETEYLFYEVVSDTMIGDSVRVYKVKRSGLKGNDLEPFEGAPYYYHNNIDSTVVYRDDFEFPQAPYSGLPMIDTRSGVGHRWLHIAGDCICTFAVTDTGSAVIFGQPMHWLEVNTINPDADSLVIDPTFHWRFVEGIGIVREGLDTLVYARIGSRSYGTIVNVRDNPEGNPEEFSLRIYPNPVYSATVVEVNGIEPELIELYVVNVLGQRVRTLFRGRAATPQHTLSWDGKDDRGNRVTNGIYFLVFKSPKQLKTQKILYFAK